ncbi:MAG: flavodoxin domain-containing protein [Halobacteriales archaeon]|nr:flavodoxin domain-containing protein [Halobacteriales archaeon]
MANILLSYATSESQTAKVAGRMADGLRARGHGVDLLELPAPLAPDDLGAYNGVIVAGSIHVGRHQPALADFVREHRDGLDVRPSAFVQVCLSAASDDPDRRAEATRYVDEFREATGWEPDLVGVFGGALRFSEYGFVKRALMKRIAADATGDTDTSRDYEYTDWDAVGAFVDEFAELVGPESVPTGHEPAAPEVTR